MRPENLKTRIFLDSGDPQETREAIKLLGFLDGQTTNPSLIAKNPETAGKKFSKQEILDFYKGVVQEISGLIPDGSVSIEVYSDAETTSEEMLAQAREFYGWITPPSRLRRGFGGQAVPPPQGEGGKRGGAHIKYPTTAEGLVAAERSIKEGMRVNMTLCFSQEQAAAVYAATRGAQKGQVFVSPFVGRLDDRGENGMDLIANIMQMYKAGDGHVEVLTASVRNMKHMHRAIELGSDIITAPLKVLKEWNTSPPPHPNPLLSKEREKGEVLRPIPYTQLDLDKDWQEFNIIHDLTDKGIEKFSQDWNSLIA